MDTRKHTEKFWEYLGDRNPAKDCNNCDQTLELGAVEILVLMLMGPHL